MCDMPDIMLYSEGQACKLSVHKKVCSYTMHLLVFLIELLIFKIMCLICLSLSDVSVLISIYNLSEKHSPQINLFTDNNWLQQ